MSISGNLEPPFFQNEPITSPSLNSIEASEERGERRRGGKQAMRLDFSVVIRQLSPVRPGGPYRLVVDGIEGPRVEEPRRGWWRRLRTWLHL